MEVKRLVLSMTLLMTVTPAAFADTPDWYLGGSAGYSDYSNVVSAAKDSGPCGLCSDNNASATGLTVLGGYRFNNHFALEAQYFDAGSATASGSQVSVSSVSFNERTQFKLTGYGLDAVGSWPFNGGMALFGKLGLVRTSLDVSSSGFFNSPGFPLETIADSVSASKTSYELGVGIEGEISQNWDYRAGYTQIFNVGDSQSTGNGNVSFIYIGCLRHF